MAWNLDDYEPVEERIAKFWADWPEGQIVTELLDAPAGEFIVKAAVWRLPMVAGQEHWPDATGLAHEVVTDRGVNSTSALENCETSAIGRALANLGYAAKGKRPSREEMAKASKPTPVMVGSAWLAEQVNDGRFALWTPEELKKAGVEAANALKVELPVDQRGAEAVLAHMENAYRVDFYPTSELPLS